MTSPAKIRANRRNALRSTGPRSAAGKAIAAANSRRHGLTVPVLDARLAAVKTQIVDVEGRLTAKMADLENRLFRKMVTLGLAATGLIITAVLFMVLNLKR